MGISYSVVFAVGKEFEDDYEVKDFLSKSNLRLTKEQEQFASDESLSELFYSEDIAGGIECTTLDLYRGWGRVLGYRVSLQPYDTLGQRISELQATFKEHFGVDADVINTVRVS